MSALTAVYPIAAKSAKARAKTSFDLFPARLQ
jgi:hypothetical protein